MKVLPAVGPVSTKETKNTAPGPQADRGPRRKPLHNLRSPLFWLCGMALAVLASPAAAQNINTIATWDGLSNLSPWDTNTTETIGEVITPTSSQTKLSSFTFEVGLTGGNTPMGYQAYVYQWNGGSRTITGPALFTSGVMTAPTSFSVGPVKINTGSLALTAGMQYVLFFTTTTVAQVSNAEYQFGATKGSFYTAGTGVYSGAGGGLSSLASISWEETALLAFEADFVTSSPSSPSSPVPPPPPPPPLLFRSFLPTATPINASNIAGALDKFTTSGGSLPPNFLNLLLLPPNGLVSGLSQLSGENNTDAQQGSFELMNSYLSLLTDPFATNRSGDDHALGFASEQQAAPAGLPKAITSAYASLQEKAPVMLDQPHWDVWGAAFGGGSTNRGDATVVGSHDSSTNVGGVAAGADYRLSRDTMLGFSLAGGKTSWNLAGGFGGGSSDAFLGGVYGRHQFGAAYLSGALTYANYWMTTNRLVTVAGPDNLQANFNAQSFGSRLEGGYRIPTRWMVDITPFAALQVQTFHTPAYGEIATGASSNQFALNFDGRNATDIRTELGARADKVWHLADASALNLFGKAAWAHDEVSDPQLSASFIGLTPVASFVVNGAAPARDLALLSGGAEWRLINGVSLMAKFDGELSDRTMTYSGTGRLRFTW